MLTLYDVGNTKNNGRYIAAADEHQAAKIAVRDGHVKMTRNARVHPLDIEKLKLDSAWGSLQAILAAGVPGTLVKRISGFSALDLFRSLAETGAPPETDGGEWILTPVE